MKAQDQQGCSRKMVYEALSRFTVMYGITFGRMKMTLSDLDGALIDIRYQDVVQIIKTIPYKDKKADLTTTVRRPLSLWTGTLRRTFISRKQRCVSRGLR